MCCGLRYLIKDLKLRKEKYVSCAVSNPRAGDPLDRWSGFLSVGPPRICYEKTVLREYKLKLVELLNIFSQVSLRFERLFPMINCPFLTIIIVLKITFNLWLKSRLANVLNFTSAKVIMSAFLRTLNVKLFIEVRQELCFLYLIPRLIKLFLFLVSW